MPASASHSTVRLALFLHRKREAYLGGYGGGNGEPYLGVFRPISITVERVELSRRHADFFLRIPQLFLKIFHNKK